MRNATENPEKVLSKVLFRLQSNTAGRVAGNECLDLDMDKSGTFDIAAQDVGVGAIPESDDCRMPSPTEFAGNEELA